MKKIGKILGLCCALLLFSGCMKYNFNVVVNNDGSVDLKYLSAISKQVMSYGGSNQQSEDDFNDAKNEGFEVKKYDDGEYEGFELAKHFKSIDDLSFEGDKDVDLSMKDGKVQLFKVVNENGKKVYKASLKFSEAQNYSSQSDSYKDNDSYKELLKGMEMKFTITLPSKSTSNNATNVSEDGKTLEWDLLTFDQEKIEFEFSLSNINNNLILYIAIGAGVLLVVGVVVFIIISKNKKTPTSNETNNVDVEIV